MSPHQPVDPVERLYIRHFVRVSFLHTLKLICTPWKMTTYLFYKWNTCLSVAFRAQHLIQTDLPLLILYHNNTTTLMCGWMIYIVPEPLSLCVCWHTYIYIYIHTYDSPHSMHHHPPHKDFLLLHACWVWESRSVMYPANTTGGMR